jgi:hypothetical protein
MLVMPSSWSTGELTNVSLRCCRGRWCRRQGKSQYGVGMTRSIKKLILRRAADVSPYFLYHKCLPSKICSSSSHVPALTFRLQGEYIPTGMPISHLSVDLSWCNHSAKFSIIILPMWWLMERLSLLDSGIQPVKRITIDYDRSHIPRPMCFWFAFPWSVRQVTRTSEPKYVTLSSI